MPGSGGVDISVVTDDFGGAEDRRWCGARAGMDLCRSITLDVSTFIAAHVNVKGAIPSGIVLGRITATGKYGPYDPAALDGRQVAAGHLLNTTKVGNGTGTDLATAPDVGVALFWGPGIVKESFLPAFAGTVAGELDAAARAALAEHIRYEA